MLEGVHRRGLPSAPWLRQAGIEPQLLMQDGARVTAAQYIALFQTLIESLNDETLSFLSRALPRGSLRLIARSTLGAPNLEAAMRRACHVLHLLQDDIHLRLERDEGLVGLVMRPRSSAAQPRFLHEFMVRATWRLAAWLAGGTLKAQRFDFSFAEPAYSMDYATTFPATRRFEQADSGFWFDARRLSRPVAQDESSMIAFIQSWPGSVIVPQRSREGVVGRVHALLLGARPQWPSLDQAAATLHVSAPTLQRQLAAVGHSFQGLKDALRRDLAIARLQNSDASSIQIAAELGFSDAASFHRAFKSWTGSPPGAYRLRI